MCVVSMIMDYGQKQWDWDKPHLPYNPHKPYQPWQPEDADKDDAPHKDKTEQPKQAQPIVIQPYNGPTKEQFEELLELLRAGKKFDDATGQPDCELDVKKELLRQIGEHLGIKFDDEFNKTK